MFWNIFLKNYNLAREHPKLTFSSIDKEIRMTDRNLKPGQTGDNCVHKWSITVIDSGFGRTHKVRCGRVQTGDLINL